MRGRICRGSAERRVRTAGRAVCCGAARARPAAGLRGRCRSITISIFREAGGAAGSRELAQRWTDENLQDLGFTRIEALAGEIMVSRAKEEMLEPGHVGAVRKFASVRQYALRGRSVAALMHKVDEIFADRIERLDGFDAYHALDCGRGEIMSISLFRDQASAEVSDDLALQFVGEELGRV